MTSDPFKHFASPQRIIAVDTKGANTFAELSKTFSELEVFSWDESKRNTDNFDALVQFAIQRNRNALLVAGCSTDQSCLVMSLLALGRGFDVYLCVDLIGGPEDEKNLLGNRLRQQGAIVVSKKQGFFTYRYLIYETPNLG